MYDISKLSKQFWSKVPKKPHNECWEWLGSRFSNQYGKLVHNKKYLKAHRVSVLIDGRNPDGYVVRHKCDNPCCVNPSHLLLGTQADNKMDSIRRGRHAKGETNGRAKLTYDKANEIRVKYSKGFTQKQIAEEYDITQVLVSMVVLNKIWVR